MSVDDLFDRHAAELTTLLDKHAPRYGDLDWPTSVPVDDLFDRHAAELTTLLDKHAPRCVRKRKEHILTPWFDDECTAFEALSSQTRAKIQEDETSR